LAAEDDDLKHTEREELRRFSKILHERHTVCQARVEESALLMKTSLWENLNFVKFVPQIYEYINFIVTVMIPFLITVMEKLNYI